MFKKILDFLVKTPQDGITDKIEKEPIVMKQWNHLGGAILFIFLTIIFSLISILFSNVKTEISPLTYKVDFQEMTQEEINVLPFPHQSFKNVSAWLQDAVSTAYSFDFLNYDQQVRNVSYYFTDLGYETYLNALAANNIRESVVGSRLQISLIPLQDPVMINGGIFGTTEFWRFRMPVLISYYGGNKPIINRVMIEVLVLRVPAYKNYKGLSIAEFNMAPM